MTLPDAATQADPACATCRGTGAIEVPDGPESASTEYCHCWWANQPQPLDLDAIEARYSGHLGQHSHMGSFACCSAHASADDVPALVAEVRRLTAELDQARQQAADTRPSSRPAELCELPHPVAANAWCELRIEHAGWHQDENGAKWPNTLIPGRSPA
jgi:hypothetical protein